MELNFIVESLRLLVGIEAVRWLLNLENFLKLGLLTSYIYSKLQPRCVFCILHAAISACCKTLVLKVLIPTQSMPKCTVGNEVRRSRPKLSSRILAEPLPKPHGAMRSYPNMHKVGPLQDPVEGVL
jgi:hypothetical protein